MSCASCSSASWPPASGPRRDTLLAGAAALSASVFGSEMFGSAGAAADGSYGLLHGIHWPAQHHLAAKKPPALLVDQSIAPMSRSLQAVAYLGRSLDGLPILLVAAARPPVESGAHRDTLAALSAEAPAVVCGRPAQRGGTATLPGASHPPPPAEDDAIGAMHEMDRRQPVPDRRGREIAVGRRRNDHPRVGRRACGVGIRIAVAARCCACGRWARTRPRRRAPSRCSTTTAISRRCASCRGFPAHECCRGDETLEACILADGAPLRFFHPLLRAAVYGDSTDRASVPSRASRSGARALRGGPGEDRGTPLVSRPADEPASQRRLIDAAEERPRRATRPAVQVLATSARRAAVPRPTPRGAARPRARRARRRRQRRRRRAPSSRARATAGSTGARGGGRRARRGPHDRPKRAERSRCARCLP